MNRKKKKFFYTEYELIINRKYAPLKQSITVPFK